MQINRLLCYCTHTGDGDDGDQQVEHVAKAAVPAVSQGSHQIACCQSTAQSIGKVTCYFVSVVE
jgi:hypothetical protein